jgi:type III restriction enzyme
MSAGGDQFQVGRDTCPTRSSTTRSSTRPTSARSIGNCTRRSGSRPVSGSIEVTPRRAEFITPIPKPKKRKKARQASRRLLSSTRARDSRPAAVRPHLDHQRGARACRFLARLPNPEPVAGDAGDRAPAAALAAPQVQRHPALLLPGRGRETAIWLTEVAPQTRQGTARHPRPPRGANQDANPELLRLALKLATGAGKTTVMAMLIAWQTINAVRRPAARTSRAAS